MDVAKLLWVLSHVLVNQLVQLLTCWLMVDLILHPASLWLKTGALNASSESTRTLGTL